MTRPIAFLLGVLLTLPIAAFLGAGLAMWLVWWEEPRRGG